jgi:hypothetical protein
MRNILLGPLCLLLFVSGSLIAQQPAEPDQGEEPLIDGKVWGGVVFAAPEPGELPGEAVGEPGKTFQNLKGRLSKAFPDYKEFTLLGESGGDIFRQYETWIVPSRDFYFKIDSEGLRPEMNGLRVHLQIWRKKDVMLKTDVVLSTQQPVFITGPKWRNGRILFMIALEELPNPSGLK